MLYNSRGEMAIAAPQTQPLGAGPEQAGSARHMTVIYNDDHTPYEAVVEVLVRATGCSRGEAEMETWEAHHYGKAPVHFGSQRDCQGAADVIGTIGVKAEVMPEWND